MNFNNIVYETMNMAQVNNYVWKRGSIKGQNKKRSNFIEWIINDIMYWLYIYFFINIKNLITDIYKHKEGHW